MNKALGVLGLARKAGALEIGEEPAGIAARSKKARALLTANDAAENTVRRIVHFADIARIPHLTLPYTKDELGGALGVRACAALAVTDAGLAASFTEKLEAEFPGKYTQPLEILRLKADKIEQRKKEARAHERNVQTGKWASSKQKGRKMNG